MLDDLIIQPEVENADAYFKTRADVLRWLQGNGYQIEHSKLYEDVKDGILRLQADGRSLRLVDVKLYAATLRTDSGENDAAREMTAQKAAKDIELLEVKIKKENFAFEKDQGKWIPKADFVRELAGRVAVFENGIKNDVQAKVAELITVCRGDVNRSREFLDHFNAIMDIRLNEMARTDRFRW